MKEKIIFVVCFVLFSGVILFQSFWATGIYYERADRMTNFCEQQSEERKADPSHCDDAQSLAETAYSGAIRQIQSLQVYLIVLFGGFTLLGYKLRTQQRELDRLMGRSDD